MTKHIMKYMCTHYMHILTCPVGHKEAPTARKSAICELAVLPDLAWFYHQLVVPDLMFVCQLPLAYETFGNTRGKYGTYQ